MMERGRAAGGAGRGAAGEAAPTGILLLNLGGPWTLAGVRPFLRSLFDDREIIPFPGGPALQGVWSGFLSSVRTPAVRKRYAAIGGGSPLLYWSRVQALGLVRGLNRGESAPLAAKELKALRAWDASKAGLPPASRADEGPYVAAIAMRYSEPTAAAALAHLAERGCARGRPPPLPAGVRGDHRFEPCRPPACDGADAADDRARRDPLLSRPSSLPPRDGGEGSRGALRLSRAGPEGSHHSLLRARRPDPNRRERGSVRPADRRDGRGTAFASSATRSDRTVSPGRAGSARSGGQGPGTDEVLRELGKAGGPGVLVVPLSFVSDHIETLHEVDIEFREVAHEAGIARFHRSPALNESPLFLDALREIVLAARSPESPASRKEA